MSQQALVQVTPFSGYEGYEYTQKTQVVRGNFAVVASASGSPASQDTYEGGGLPVSWALEGVKTLASPFEVQVWSSAGSGYQYVYNQVNGGTLQIFTSSNVELANDIEIPAAVLADTIQFRAVFAKFDFFSS